MTEKRKPGRPPGKKDGPMSAHHREKIAKSNVLNRMIRMAEGKLSPAGVGGDQEMTPAQVQAGIALMNKFLPNISSQEIKQDIKTEKVVNKIVIESVSPKKSDE